MRVTNELCEKSPYRFRLPSLDLLAEMLEKLDGKDEKFFMTELDISNHYWSCKVPAGEEGQVRIAIGSRVFSIPSLPFGWTHSPPIAQKLLALTLAKRHPGEVIVIQYVDDILIMGPSQEGVDRATRDIVQLLESEGWLVSPKSVTTPQSNLSWMGKEIKTGERTIGPTPAQVATME